MYFYHKVMSDVLSVNEKYRNVRQGGGKHTHWETHSFHLSEGFFLACGELSCSDKNNGFGAMAQGDRPPIPSW